MKKKAKRGLLAGVALLAMVALAAPATAGPDDRDLPDEDDIFWQVLSVMSSPADATACQNKINEMAADGTLLSYIEAHRDDLEEEGDPQGGEWEHGGPSVEEMAQGFGQMCTMLAQMPTEMQTGMAQDGVVSSLFSAPSWHSVSGLYFQKTGEGRISFSQTVDFLTYRFFLFMSNFDNMIQFDNGYISLNAAMVPEMINYGTTFTMFGLDFEEQPDIYVSNGQTMRKAIEGTDLSGISYDVGAGTLTFTPRHFSSFKAVEKNSRVRTMKITSVKKKSIKYKANKNSFKLTVRGRNFRQGSGEADCTLGFKQAQKIYVSKNGRQIKCTFDMSEFSVTGYYPLTVTIDGVGEVTRTNAVRIR